MVLVLGLHYDQASHLVYLFKHLVLQDLNLHLFPRVLLDPPPPALRQQQH